MMMVTHAYTDLYIVEGEAFRRMVTQYDILLQTITRSKLTRILVPQKLNKTETDISSLLHGMHFAVISYDLWMSNTTQEIFQ